MQSGGRRRGRLIAVANMKGGVGKTTTVVSLAESFAADDLDASVLVVDLDPQASASVCIAGDDLLSELIQQRRTIEAILEEKIIEHKQISLEQIVCDQISTVSHRGRRLDLSLLPCGPHLRELERHIIFELAQRDFGWNAVSGKIWKIFDQDLSSLKQKYDYIIFDCAPGLSPVSEAAIRVADLVIVPTIPDILSVYGLNAFHGGIWVQRSAMPKPKSRPHILVTRWQATRQHREMCDDLEIESRQEGAFYELLRSKIPQSAALADAVVKEGDVPYTRKYTSAFIDTTLIPLVDEIKELL